MRTLKNRRALFALIAGVAILLLIGAVGALSSSDRQDAMAQKSLRAEPQAAFRDKASASAASPMAFTAGGIGGAPAAAGVGAASGDARGTIAASAPEPAGPRIVKTGSIDVEVRKSQFGPAFARLTSIATNLGGFVSSSKTFESSDVPNGTVTLRVPSDKFDELVRQVRGMGKVRAVSSSGEDVTAKFTDLRARLRSLEAQRDQYLALLSKANSIADTLAVRDRLNQVQTEVEQLQGQLKLLDDQASFATLTVNVAEPGLAPLGPQPESSGWSKAWDDAVHGFVRGAQAIVAHSGAVLLVLVCAAALAALGWVGWRVIATRTSPVDLAQKA